MFFLSASYIAGFSFLATLISLREKDRNKLQIWDKNDFLNFSRAFAFPR
jgi:hypothetical protein